MGSFVGCSSLHGVSFSECLQSHEQGGLFRVPIPPSSGSLKHKTRRRVLASGSAAEVCGFDHMKKKENRCMNRRATLALFALSACPFFAPRSRAADVPATDRKVATLSVTSQKSEIVDTTSPTQRQNAKEEFLDQNESPGSIIFGVLNELGIIGSGVLGALYLLERKENAATESTLESVTAKLKEKEVAMTSLRENLEGKILEEKEKSLKQDKKTQEEQAFLRLLKAKPSGKQVACLVKVV